MPLLVLFAAMALLGLSSPEAFAEEARPVQADARIKRSLDELGLKYETAEGGRFKLLFETEGNRSHLVFIDSETESYGGIEIREIWAVGYESEKPFSQKTANRLLESSFSNKLGGWGLSKADKRYTAVFAARLHANCTKEALQDAIELVSESADAIEKELSGKDEF